MKQIKFSSALILLFASCEKVVDLKLDQNNSKYIIEGSITNQAPPYEVKITKSVSFTETNNFPTVADAQVIISDDAGTTDTLTHTGDGIYKTNKIVGTQGRTYNLKVMVGDKMFTSFSTMPNKVALDSLRVNTLSLGGQTRKAIIPSFIDPITYGNSYRFLLYKNSVLDPSYIVTNDDVNNGKQNQRPLISNSTQFEKGDTATVEMQCVSANTYLYYFTLAQMANNGPGGGTTPTNPPNSMSGGALGIFSAHTTERKVIIIP